MINFISRSLMSKLILVLMLVALMPVAIVGYMSYSSGKASLQQDAFDSLRAIVEGREHALILFLEGQQETTMGFATDGAIRSHLEGINQKGPNAGQMSDELSQYLISEKMVIDEHIYELFVTDSKGIIVASSDMNNIGKDKSSDEYFINGRNGAYIKDAYYSKSSGKDSISFSAPLKSMSSDNLLGVIVSRVETSLLNEITTRRHGLGETGEVYIVNKDGYMISESRFIKDAFLNQKVDTKPVKLFQNRGEIMTGIYPGYRGEQIVGASDGEHLSAEFGWLGWTILAEKDVNEAFAKAEALGQRILLVAFIVGVVAIVIAFFVSKGIADPVKSISDSITRVAGGDLTIEVPVNGRQDEVGVLTRSFADMTDSLRQMAAVAERIADSDLTMEIRPKSEKDILGKAYEKMADNLRRQTGEIKEGANLLATASGEISATISQLAASAQEMASSVTEMSTTMEELKQTAGDTNEKAKNVSQSSQKAVSISDEGKKSTEAAIDGMKLIHSQMGSIAESIVKLSEQSQAIGDIVTSVNDLADQSNLLAVNASIEATKAGEQGKGFTVVAQEVKSLADQSKQATAQIRNILNDIQKATSSAVMSTEQGSKAVESGVAQSDMTGESIKTLSNSVRESAQAAVMIAASGQQQLVGIDQVATAMESIRNATDQNLDASRQLETAAGNLNELGQKLRRSVELYKV